MYKVAVTGLNAGDTPAVGIPVIRSLKEHKDWQGRIIGLTYDAFDPGILSEDIIDSGYLLPYPRLGTKALLQRVNYIHERENLDVIIPNVDTEFLSFIKIEEGLLKMGIRTFIPTEEQFRKRSKANLGKLSHEVGIKALRTWIVTDPSSINLRELHYPKMVKGELYEAYIAYSHVEALQCIHKIASKWGYPVLLQDYIEGEEYNACALGDGSGRMLGIMCMKKLVITEKGKGWAGVSIKHNGFIELVAKILNALKWRGAIEIETIYSKKEDCFYLIDLNPRFPAWIYLSKAAGINLPFMYLQLALGEKVSENFEYTPGIVFSNFITNIITDLSKVETLFTHGEIRK